MNTLLQDIAVKSSADLCDLIREGEKDILTAIHKLQHEAQLNDSNPKFTLGFKISVDFEKATYDCDLSWSLKQTLSTSHKIEDPNQGKLEIENN